MKRSAKLTATPVETAPEPLMAATEEDVIWCYRSILGRNPESAEVVRERVADTKNLGSLVLSFIGSDEFKKKPPDFRSLVLSFVGSEVFKTRPPLDESTNGADFPSDLFDHDWYADGFRLSPDLPGETRRTLTVQHYLEYGSRERRDPNPLFDAKWYAAKFDLPADVDPLVHYAQHEKNGGVSPNPSWESASHNLLNPPPPLSRVLRHYPLLRKPTYIVGLFGTGRAYISDLLVNSDVGIPFAYYFRDALPIYNGATPFIFSGHVTSSHVSAGCSGPDVAHQLFNLAAARRINLIFIYRHPLDSLLLNWSWFRYLHQHKLSFGSMAASGYYSYEELLRILNENIYEFSLFCGGSKDFARILTGSDINPTFLSLLEFIHETEIFVGNPNVHSFRFEDFLTDGTREVTRLVSILAPDLTPKLDNVPIPRSRSNRYQLAKQHVPSFRALMASMPTDLMRRIEALGYAT